jgi:membrane protein DedA with SNARE-associated domain
MRAVVISRAERISMGVTGTRLEPSPVNVRVKISALWMSMLFVFAYVDLFSLYRPDFRADVEAGEVGGFAVNQTFLLATTAYVVIPSLMVFCVLVLRPRLNRILNIALAIVYAVSIIAATIGEWTYYILGSLIEAALLAAVVFYAWTWPKEIGQTT